MTLDPKDLLSALVGDPAARVRLADAAAGSQDTLGDYAAKLGGNLGPLAPLLTKLTGAAQKKSTADTQSALRSAASGNIGAIVKSYAVPAALVAAAVGFLFWIMGRASK